MTGYAFAVASGKGGVGKTTTVVNLGVAFRMAEESVVLVDGDLGMPNVGAFLGVQPERTIHDVLAGEVPVGEAVAEAADGFGVLAGDPALEGFSAVDPDRLVGVVEALREEYAYVLVDTAAGLSYEAVLPLGMVDEVVLVTTGDPAAVADTGRTIELARAVDARLAGVVVTRDGDRVDAAGIAGELGVDLLGVVPEESVVAESVATGVPLEKHAPDSGAAGAYRELCAVLRGHAPPGGPIAAGEEGWLATGGGGPAAEAEEVEVAGEAGEGVVVEGDEPAGVDGAAVAEPAPGATGDEPGGERGEAAEVETEGADAEGAGAAEAGESASVGAGEDELVGESVVDDEVAPGGEPDGLDGEEALADVVEDVGEIPVEEEEAESAADPDAADEELAETEVANGDEELAETEVANGDEELVETEVANGDEAERAAEEDDDDDDDDDDEEGGAAEVEAEDEPEAAGDGGGMFGRFRRLFR